MVPILKSAITDFTTVEQYAEWVEPFVGKFVKICKPGHTVSLEEVADPQDEESKDPLTFKQKLKQSVDQFVALVDEIEEQATGEKAQLLSEIQRIDQSGLAKKQQAVQNKFKSAELQANLAKDAIKKV